VENSPVFKEKFYYATLNHEEILLPNSAGPLKPRGPRPWPSWPVP